MFRLAFPSVALPRIAGPRAGPRGLTRRRVLAAGSHLVAWTVAAVTLFTCYLHVASSGAVTSDGASNALQAWNMLHGNPLLRGWQLSDVSFYTTELPQYLVIEALIGLGPQVVHVASAMTYTLLILLAALLAKGSPARGGATGREAILRCLIVAGIMAAPQVGSGVSVLLGSPDHVGSAVPVLVVFLLLDRARRRWYVAVAAGLLLCMALIGDGIVMYTAVVPVIAVCAVRVYQARFRAGQKWRTSSFELMLAGSAAAAVWLAGLVLTTIRHAGGFFVWPVPATLAAPGDIPHYLYVAGRGLLLLFGANFFGHNAGFVAALAFTHLIGLGLVAWATIAAIRRLADLELTAQVLACGIVVMLAAYVLGTRAEDLLTSRDLTAVLPFGAALAGRLVAGRLAEARLLPAMALVLAAYLCGLGRVVTLPPAPAQSADLATWLGAHHLDYGLAGYWDANVTTLDTGGAIALRSVLANGRQITGDYWEVRSSWYDARAHDANFLVLVPGPPGFKRYPTVASVRSTFGQPSRIYYVGSYTIIVYDQNLLTSLVPGAPKSPPRAPAVPVRRPLPAPDG